MVMNPNGVLGMTDRVLHSRGHLRWLAFLSVSAFTAACATAQIPRPADAPNPLAPEQSAAAFNLPDGFRLQLVASEPLIASPSGTCWDERGRLFVSELHGYNLEGQLDIEELNKTGKLDTQVRRVQAEEQFKQAAEPGTYGVVKLLRDTDGDGRMDAADVWSTNLPPAYGLVPARGGVIVACAPHILYFADRDGDGRAEIREVLFTGFRTGALERGINAPQWGVDGWIYFGRGWGGGRIAGPRLAQPVELPGSDFRIRADGSAIEPVTGATGTFGFAITEAGDRFTMSTVEPGRYIAPLPWRYLIRNPDVATSGLERSTGDRRVYPLAPAHPWRQKRADDAAYFKFYRDRYGASDSDASGWFTSACSPLIYQDRVLPGLQGQYFVCEPSGNIIHRALIEADGSALTLLRAPGEERSEFAPSSDPWSHPMNLTHGPDGAIWIVDYYREIIEDYSAIPRHLQQQYGVYAGHDRGRIYRLTHRDAAPAPSPDMSALDDDALARETASSLLWRRQTAQRLLQERAARSIAPSLRAQLATPGLDSAAVINMLRTLDAFNALEPADVRPFLAHNAESVRIHALQLADRWFHLDAGRPVFEAALAAAALEPSARVQIQFALSLGESRDPRAFDMLARYAREKLAVRWMDTAILSSLRGRGEEMLAKLLDTPSVPATFLSALAQTVAARRDESELAETLRLLSQAPARLQEAVLAGLAQGRKNAPPAKLSDPTARATLATLGASPEVKVRETARSLEATFNETAPSDETLIPAGALPPAEPVSDATFARFVAALAGPRDLERGRQVFLQACATCHRIGAEGHEVGPDVLGQVGLGEEALLKDLLLPNERTRPGYETTLVQTTGGSGVVGILRDDGATSLTLALPNGADQVLLRKDVVSLRRLSASLMPSFAESLAPADAAHVLAWLRSNLAAPPPNTNSNWPQFRGPNASGFSTKANPPDRWSATEHVAWKTDVPGRSWSSPVVWNERVFLTTVVNAGESETPKKGLYFGGERPQPSKSEHQWKVLALDLATGDVRWERTVHRGAPQTPIHLKSSYGAETPVTDGARVYAVFGGLGIFAFTLDGQAVWSKPLEPRRVRNGWGSAASPVVHDGRLFLVNDNDDKAELLALDGRTGAELWRVDRDEKSNWATPFVWDNGQRAEVVTCGTRAVRSYSLDGKLLWSLRGMSSIAIPTPVAADGLLYVSSGYVGDAHRPLYAIRPAANGDISLEPNSTHNAFIAWSDPVGGPYNPSPLYYQGRLYVLFDRGLVSCRDAKTGRVLYDRERLPNGLAFTSSPWAAGDRVFCLNEDGVCFVLRAGDRFELLHTNQLADDDMCMATPALAGDRLLIRTSARLYCIR
jgi:putative membrane-bound dehydrogenase-like protein